MVKFIRERAIDYIDEGSDKEKPYEVLLAFYAEYLIGE